MSMFQFATVLLGNNYDVMAGKPQSTYDTTLLPFVTAHGCRDPCDF